jgi:NAD(P)-dependent dehydrogenase (short-subunit alcohol dehydrogenase family)
MTVKDQRVLVTGGTSGIGEATARAYAAAGADVVITGRDEQRGREIVDSLARDGARARFVRADLERMEDVQRLVGEVGDVDVLVNDAGAFPVGATHEVERGVFDATFAVNVRAPFFLTAALAPRMAANGGGAIVNISTMVASFGAPGMALYGSTKAALELLTKAWAAEYGPKGVRVNAIAPDRPAHRAPSPWARPSTVPPQRCPSAARQALGRSPTSPYSSAPTRRPMSTAQCSPSTAAARPSERSCAARFGPAETAITSAGGPTTEPRQMLVRTQIHPQTARRPEFTAALGRDRLRVPLLHCADSRHLRTPGDSPGSRRKRCTNICDTECATVRSMASRIVRARLDEASERALSVLMREGRNESEAVRAALSEAGRRRARRSALAAEVDRLASDPADTAERRAVMADMDAVAADWPA